MPITYSPIIYTYWHLYALFFFFLSTELHSLTLSYMSAILFAFKPVRRRCYSFLLDFKVSLNKMRASILHYFFVYYLIKFCPLFRFRVLFLVSAIISSYLLQENCFPNLGAIRASLACSTTLELFIFLRLVFSLINHIV